MPKYSAMGSLATFDSSSVSLPFQPGSTYPAVEWISRPRRPSDDLPSSRATISSGSSTHSSVWPSTNSSPGWRASRRWVDEIVGELDPFERLAEHELARVQHER